MTWARAPVGRQVPAAERRSPRRGEGALRVYLFVVRQREAARQECPAPEAEQVVLASRGAAGA